jgi:hypothetical protein
MHLAKGNVQNLCDYVEVNPDGSDQAKDQFWSANDGQRFEWHQVESLGNKGVAKPFV